MGALIKLLGFVVLVAFLVTGPSDRFAPEAPSLDEAAQSLDAVLVLGPHLPPPARAVRLLHPVKPLPVSLTSLEPPVRPPRSLQ